MTLKAIAEGLLSAFMRNAEDIEGLNFREDAVLRALDKVYDRRFLEIRTAEEMQRKAAAAAGADHDGEKDNRE